MQSSTVTRATSELQTHQFRERAAASTMARESQFPGGSSAGPLAPLRSNAYSREMTSGTPAAAIAPIDMTIDELRGALARVLRSEEHTSELQSLMRISYAVFCLKKKNKHYI